MTTVWRLFFISFVLFLSLLSNAAAGTALRETFQSKVLNRDYGYTVYIPDGYEKTNARYPVLYLLHGANGNENDWLVSVRIQPVVDKMIASGEIPPMIIVMPGHTQSWWIDGRNEKAETSFTKELIPHIESTYRVISERQGRLVGGLSAGGYGTVNLVLKYPEMFAAAAALSPAGGVPVPQKDSSAYGHKQFQLDGKFDTATWEMLNWPAQLEGYKNKNVKVPLFIASGDHDRFDIAYHSAALYQAFRGFQPSLVDFRVVDGDHDWPTWQATFPEALMFMAKFVSRPQVVR